MTVLEILLLVGTTAYIAHCSVRRHEERLWRADQERCAANLARFDRVRHGSEFADEVELERRAVQGFLEWHEAMRCQLEEIQSLPER